MKKPGRKTRSRELLLFSYGKKIAAFCQLHGITPELFYSDRKDARIVNARRDVAAMMRQDGISFPQIGLLLNRDHSTIINLLDPKKYRPTYKHYKNKKAPI